MANGMTLAISTKSHIRGQRSNSARGFGIKLFTEEFMKSRTQLKVEREKHVKIIIFIILKLCICISYDKTQKTLKTNNISNFYTYAQCV